MKRLLVISSTLVVLLPVSVSAQNFSGPLSSGAFESTLNMGPIAQSLRQQTEQTATPLPAPQADPASLVFKPDASVRQRTLAAMAAQARKTADVAIASELEKMFANPELFPTIEKELGRFRLRTDNVADAYAVWWINMWQASRGQTEDPSLPSVQAVRDQAERALLTTPMFVSANDALKQELAESLLIRGMLISTAVAQVKNDPGQMKAITGMVLQNGHESGLDLAAMTLTDQGFVQQ